MMKESTATHKIPYFNISTQTLESVDKIKHDFHDIMCVCSPTDDCSEIERPPWGGYKYQFQYSIQPTQEPISYKLKGYKWSASLTYNNIGEDISTGSMSEVLAYMEYIKSSQLSGVGNAELPPLVNNVNEFKWNEFNNQTFNNKIFQKTKRFEQRGEVYSPTQDLSRVCMNMNISSQIYTVNAKFAIIDWHQLGI